MERPMRNDKNWGCIERLCDFSVEILRYDVTWNSQLSQNFALSFCFLVTLRILETLHFQNSKQSENF